MTSHAHAPGWEHQALDSIKSALGDSDPKLAALLAMFGQLASSEQMPGHEKIRFCDTRRTAGAEQERRTAA